MAGKAQFNWKDKLRRGMQNNEVIWHGSLANDD